MDREEQSVWEAVRYHRGKENSVLGPTLAAMTEIDYTKVREIISHLVKRHSCLIASHSKGYYIPVTAEEVDEATRSLRHRGISILVRAAKLQKTSITDIFNQALLEFDRAPRRVHGEKERP
ncbi:MAG TPA: hypothetical protein ENH31_00465 [Nitrospirae bacterium]|nr:hypothetical protein [Nitrospirota bacterium]HDK41418.1 hypothetical protein [Nitrospirota bacterium]HDK81025.1 hypothetical protein [Nitrospirota bacterium]